MAGIHAERNRQPMARAALKEVPAIASELPPGCGLGAIATWPAKPELGAEWVEVTASLAAQWHDMNIVNRRLRPKRIEAIAGDILGDAWIPDGATIVFVLVDGVWQQMDGQHRTDSILKAAETNPDVAVLTLVVWGVAPKARRVKDTGAPRTVGDFLTMEHQVVNATTVAAIANRWASWKALTAKAAETGGADERYMVANARNTHSRQIATFEDPANNELILRAAKFATWATGRDPSMRKVTKAAWGISWLVFNEATGHSPTDNTAEYFLTTCVTGEDIHEGDPAYSFRRRMQSAFAERERVTESAVLYYLFYSWLAYRSRKRLGKLQLPRGPITAANFPIPR
jgi:hypothetical protein